MSKKIELIKQKSVLGEIEYHIYANNTSQAMRHTLEEAEVLYEKLKAVIGIPHENVFEVIKSEDI